MANRDVALTSPQQKYVHVPDCVMDEVNDQMMTG